MTEKIGNYSIKTSEAYNVLNQANIKDEKDLKKLDKNGDMIISEDELVEVALSDDDEKENSSSSSNSTNSAQSDYDDILIMLYQQMDNLMNQKHQINNRMGTAQDEDTFNKYKQQSDNLQNQISNVRGQILNTYMQAESAAMQGISGTGAAGLQSGGNYTYSGNSADFVNNFNNSSFNKGVLAGQGAMVASIAEENGLDPNLLASIMALETGWGTSSAIKNYNNPGGMMDPSSNWMSLTHYSSLEEGIRAVAKNLKNNYINQGLTTISSIGAKYCPVGAANDPNGTNSGWVPSVTSIYNQLTGANINANTNLFA